MTDLKVKQRITQCELKWSVAGLKNGLLQNDKLLPGATFILRCKEIDEFPQQIKESTDAKD